MNLVFELPVSVFQIWHLMACPHSSLIPCQFFSLLIFHKCMGKNKFNKLAPVWSRRSSTSLNIVRKFFRSSNYPLENLGYLTNCKDNGSDAKEQLGSIPVSSTNRENGSVHKRTNRIQLRDISRKRLISRDIFPLLILLCFALTEDEHPKQEWHNYNPTKFENAIVSGKKQGSLRLFCLKLQFP